MMESKEGTLRKKEKLKEKKGAKEKGSECERQKEKQGCRDNISRPLNQSRKLLVFSSILSRGCSLFVY